MGDPGREPAVLARRLTKSYGDGIAVAGIDFDVSRAAGPVTDVRSPRRMAECRA